MQPSSGARSSSGSLHPTDAPTSLYERTTPKLSLEQGLRLEEEVRNEGDETFTASPQGIWRSRLQKIFASKHPLMHSRIIRIVKYFRGPRPKIELPEQKPLLDLNLNLKGCRVILPLESTLIRVSGALTAPWILLLLGVAYIIGFAFLSRVQSFITPASSFIGCTSTYWASNNGCGLDGQLCAPFNDSLLDFRCPAQCESVILQNPRTIGNEQIAFKPLIVGGGDVNRTYRGDSFICAAAIQAGLISNSHGGCASLQLVGNFTNFISLTANGLTSIGFPTVFPLSFRLSEHTVLTHCQDNRTGALVFNIVITCFLFMILRPKPIILYWCLVCIGFWHVALFSQPQGPPPPFGLAFGTFLPSLFIAYGFWRLALRFTLPTFSGSPIEATVWYLAPYWAGVLFNLTTAKIPISRLLASDLTKRAGAIPSFVIILVIVTVMVINQVRVIRKTGWLLYYAGWYILGGIITLVISQLPGLTLRLHHYIVSMILMPITGFPTRLSAIYQGFLLGMFLNGAAAFGLDSILQTAAELRQDAPLRSSLPTFLTNSTTYNSSIPLINQTISWNPLPDGWDGFSLLVDDVERYAGTAFNFSLAAFQAGIPHFFRLAFTAGSETGDFTMPAILWPNGTWVDPLPGPS